MKEALVQEIIDCLPKGRTKFYYFKDRYALMLLSYIAGKGMPARKLKQGPFGKLVRRPVVQKIITRAGNGVISRQQTDTFWPAEPHCYLLSLGKWGDDDRSAHSWNQTSRPGWNLVLQLNFSERHNRPYARLVKPGEHHPFKNSGHPIARSGHTLAWARIDLDMTSGEALIEEIQNDWLRMAMESRAVVRAYESGCYLQRGYTPWYVRNMGGDSRTLTQYIEGALKPHLKLWGEAMLAATIWFLREEIGIGKIYYHTYDFGCRLKRIDYGRPPRSVYTRLPEQFCFRRTDRPPSFLLRENKRCLKRILRNNAPSFFFLDL